MEPDEYARMAAIEARMWWYRALHSRLLDAIADHSVARETLARDIGARDTGAHGNAARDTVPRDTVPRDAWSRDTGARDTGARDTGAHDNGAPTPGTRDTAVRDSGACPIQDGPILDAGCGTGGLLALLDPACIAYGLEWHEPAAAIARAKSGRPVARGSINDMPFADRRFAIVIAADVLCHAAVEPAQALGEIHRVLRPGGRLIVNMPAFHALMSAHDARVHNARRMSAGQTRTMLEAAGFRVRRLRYWNSLLLPLMVMRRKLPWLSSEGSDVAAFPPWLDRMLHGMTEFERRLPFGFPAGGSVLAIAERP
jgi:SAM-dependent methyltransferase